MKTQIKIGNWDEVVSIANDPNQPMPKRSMDMINKAEKKATDESKKNFVDWVNDILNNDALSHDWMIKLSNGRYIDFFENK